EAVEPQAVRVRINGPADLSEISGFSEPLPRWRPSSPLFGSGQSVSRRFSFLANSGYATISAGSAVLLLGLLMLAGRFLTAVDYGKFSFALALATIVETIMDIGLGPVTVREVARDREGAGRFFRHVLGLKLLWVTGGLVLLLIVAPALRSDPTV